jgi:hypothetical protein
MYLFLKLLDRFTYSQKDLIIYKIAARYKARSHALLHLFETFATEKIMCLSTVDNVASSSAILSTNFCHKGAAQGKEDEYIF